MYYTYNITFVVLPHEEKELVRFLREELIPEVFNDNDNSHHVEIRKVIETGGERLDPNHGVSIALAGTFHSEEAARLWRDNKFLPAVSNFNLRFGNEAVYFMTLLENL